LPGTLLIDTTNIECKDGSGLGIVLQAGDPIAYNCGFTDYCDVQEIEIEEG